MEGTVRFAAEGATGSGFGGYGLTVAVQDHRGYLHCYAHLSRIAVSVGQRVKRGQLLGNQGSTGQSTGPHVHYEIRKTSTPSYGYTASVDGVVEPEAYLQSEFGSTSEEQEALPMTSEEKLLKRWKRLWKLRRPGSRSRRIYPTCPVRLGQLKLINTIVLISRRTQAVMTSGDCWLLCIVRKKEFRSRSIRENNKGQRAEYDDSYLKQAKTIYRILPFRPVRFLCKIIC